MLINAPLCRWQQQEMARLREQHPESFFGAAVYHGTDLPPDQVLLSGIPATGGENFDLAAHQRQEKGSALRGSCQTADIPAQFAGTGAWVYKLYAVGGGIDVNTALGDKRLDYLKGALAGSIMPGEHEIAIASHQPSCQIEGYFQVGSYSDLHEKYRLGPFVPNPHFKPGAWQSANYNSKGQPVTERRR